MKMNVAGVQLLLTPCMGSACHYRNVKHLYCDRCKDDVEKLYKYDGQELCDECLLSKFEVVEYE